MKYQFYAIIFDVAGNQVSSKSASSPLSIKTQTQLVTSVSISPNTAQTKNIGETFTITPTVGPANANNKNVNWTSSNTNVATVSKASTASGTAVTITCKVAGTTTITATAADGSGKTTSLSLTVIIPTLINQISENNYGDYINYPVDLGIKSTGNTLADGSVPKADWRVFYKDSTYVYLIVTDYIQKTKFPSGVFNTTNGKYCGYWSSSTSSIPSATATETYKNSFLFTKMNTISTSNINFKATSVLLDVSKWTNFVNNTYAQACIGSPTVEMWIASWNQKYSLNSMIYDTNSYGYNCGYNSTELANFPTNGFINTTNKSGYSDSLYYPHKEYLGECGGYWLASPSTWGGANTTSWRRKMYFIYTMLGRIGWSWTYFYIQ